MAQVTDDMCDHIIGAADKGERFPLTVNEMRQLAYLARNREGMMLTTSDQMQKVFSNFVNGMMVLKPPERAEVFRWISECYCPQCGYPAPPRGEACACDAVQHS